MQQVLDTQVTWVGASVAFAALGRVFICLDRHFRIVYASDQIDRLLGPGGTEAVSGRPIEHLIGDDVIGPESVLRRAALAGERLEGYRAVVRSPRGPHLVSLSLAPLPPGNIDGADPRVAFLLVLRPEESAEQHETPTVFEGLIARSAALRRIFALVQDLRHSDATVLITGESGSGKELLARAMHRLSPRRDRAFVAVKCGAIRPELLDSELFGHVRGAVPGATRDRVGRLELAARGTLFLDEVDALPAAVQVKLLRVLQDRIFERVGDTRAFKSDVRIIAAVTTDLRAAVAQGRFREDLFYRLRIVHVDVPPLRERHEDVEPLAEYLLARVGARHGRALRFSPDAIRAMQRYDWPGNAREVEAAVEHAVAVCSGQTVLPEDLPREITATPRARLLGGNGQAAAGPDNGNGNSHGAVDRRAANATCDKLQRALAEHRWNRRDTARALGISRTTLWRLMRDAGLQRTGQRAEA